MKNTEHNLLDSIYETIVYPDHWDGLLNKIVEHFHLQATNVFFFDKINGPLNTVRLSSAFNGHLPTYLEGGYYDIEKEIFPHIPKVIARENLLSERDMLERLSSEFNVIFPDVKKVHEWLKDQFGIYDRYIANLNISNSFREQITFHLGKKSRSETKIIEQKARALLPHLSRAIRFSRPFEMLYQSYSQVLSVLDKFYLGVIILKSDNTILIKNQAADLMIDKGDCWRIDGKGRLKITRTEAIRHYEDAKKMITSSAARTANFLAPQRGCLPYFCRVSFTKHKDLLNVDPCYVLIIIDPCRHDIVDVTGVAKVFNLSAAEEDVLQHLIQGRSNSEIADIRGVSAETIKTQISSIFIKLTCSNRVEVINLAHTISIPIDLN